MKTFIKNFIPFSVGVKLRGGWQKLLKVYYSGEDYFCPFCNNSFRKLLPGGFDFPVIKEKQIIGAGYRKNNVCPRCYSTDRDRLVYYFLNEKTDAFTRNIKLLHIAPEGCLKSLLLKKTNITYFQGDKFTEGYHNYYYDRKVTYVDIKKIPYPDNEFDALICNHVLEHIKEHHQAIKELYRVLKPGGWAILQVPISKNSEKTFEVDTTSPAEREKLFGQFDHVRIYGQDYPKILENFGFKVTVFNPKQEGLNEKIAQFAINPLENIYMAIK